jgi:hypothetical protein
LWSTYPGIGVFIKIYFPLAAVFGYISMFSIGPNVAESHADSTENSSSLFSNVSIADFQEPYGIVVLLDNDLVVVDLTTEG